MIGTIVNGYQIERILGEGGMGVVYVARHCKLGLEKCVKVLRQECSERPDLVARFEREARSIAALSHDNILTIENYGLFANGQPWIMTEKLNGEPLDQRLCRGRLNEQSALAVILQLCCAVQHAHDRGVIHRDLKPGNVFVCPNRIKLLDFGLAKLTYEHDGAHTRAGMAFGTPNYMAVETRTGTAATTAQSDIYALAIMAVEMVTGRLPWGYDDTDLVYRQMHVTPNLEGLSEGWQRVVSSALAVNASDRPISAKAFGLALVNVTLEGLAIACKVAEELLRETPSVRPSLPSAPTAVVPVTTLGLSNGTFATNNRQTAHWKLVLAALALCGLVSAVTFIGTRPAPVIVPTRPAPVIVPTRTIDAGIVIFDAAVICDAAVDATPRIVTDAAITPRPPPPPRRTNPPVKPVANDDFDPSSPTGK